MNNYLVEFPNGTAISVEAINSNKAFLEACRDPRGGVTMSDEELDLVMMIIAEKSEGYITEAGVVWVTRARSSTMQHFEAFVRHRFNRD